MPGIRDVLEAAPAVGDVLVLGQSVSNQRKGALIGLEGLSERLCRNLALGAVAVLQQIERRLDRELLGPDLEAQARDGLVEQPVEGGISGLRLLQEELLELVVELVRLLLAQILDPGTVVRELGGLHRAVQNIVIDAIELEREEQQMRRCRRQALGNVAVKL